MLGTHLDDVAMKLRLRKVRLNSQGYDSDGRYWGCGEQLWELELPDTHNHYHTHQYFRSASREWAKKRVLCMFPQARFYN